MPPDAGGDADLDATFPDLDRYPSAVDNVRRFLDVNVPVQAAGALFVAFCLWFATISGHVQVVAVIGERESNVASFWAYIRRLGSTARNAVISRSPR